MSEPPPKKYIMADTKAKDSEDKKHRSLERKRKAAMKKRTDDMVVGMKNGLKSFLLDKSEQSANVKVCVKEKEQQRVRPPEKASLAKIVDVGIRNLGNTCYISATVQALRRVQVFSELMCSETFTTIIGNVLLKYPNQCLQHDRAIMLAALSTLMKDMKSVTSSRQPVAPIRLRASLEEMKSPFWMGTQQDCVEFMQFVFSSLQGVLMENVPTGNRVSNFVDDNFVGHRVTTFSSGSGRDQPFLILDLPIPNPLNNSVSLDDCFNLLCRSEVIRSNLTLSVTLSLPTYLIVQLKRFQSVNGSPLKTHTRVTFDVDRVDLTDYDIHADKDNQKSIYTVRSIIYHQGKSLECGHYTCLSRNDQGDWMFFNDGIVSGPKFELDSNDAYLLVLERQHDIAKDSKSSDKTEPPKKVENFAKQTVAEKLELPKAPREKPINPVVTSTTQEQCGRGGRPVKCTFEMCGKSFHLLLKVDPTIPKSLCDKLHVYASTTDARGVSDWKCRGCSHWYRAYPQRPKSEPNMNVAAAGTADSIIQPQEDKVDSQIKPDGMPKIEDFVNPPFVIKSELSDFPHHEKPVCEPVTSTTLVPFHAVNTLASLIICQDDQFKDDDEKSQMTTLVMSQPTTTRSSSNSMAIVNPRNIPYLPSRSGVGPENNLALKKGKRRLYKDEVRNPNKRPSVNDPKFECPVRTRDPNDPAEQEPTTKFASFYERIGTMKDGPVRSLVCVEKNRIFSQGSSFRKHYKQFHGTIADNPHICGQCDMTFAQLKDLTRHEKKHATHRPTFDCDMCSKKYLNKESLDKHKKNAHGNQDELPFPCTFPLCGKRFLNYSEVLEHSHSVVHFPRKIFNCRICKHEYKSAVGAAVCELDHLKGKVECRYCNRFYKPSYISTHEPLHNKRDYYCQFCLEGFDTLRQYMEHCKLPSHDDKLDVNGTFIGIPHAHKLRDGEYYTEPTLIHCEDGEEDIYIPCAGYNRQHPEMSTCRQCKYTDFRVKEVRFKNLGWTIRGPIHCDERMGLYYWRFREESKQLRGYGGMYTNGAKRRSDEHFIPSSTDNKLAYAEFHNPRNSFVYVPMFAGHNISPYLIGLGEINMISFLDLQHKLGGGCNILEGGWSGGASVDTRKSTK